ncbi:TIGR00341 family protein [Portibacter lacus]|uniref:DUF389 domain-containing protein n=1 Tax=Portibacter lacus TaxID=1099794 RepID=A0AA37SP43_9BACT|nr:TIGR00341 family protein [Portibacter lacus]GLR17410.1 DUF389 domain-containing protein [Portibacter lacus]
MALQDNDANGNSPINDEPQIEFSHVKNFFLNILNEIWDLKHGVDKAATIEEINSRKSLSGANAWMLICSIMIASIGLDRNSPAVIIGAMLISPLMAPILGIGLGVGINDRRVIKTSLQHFSVAIFIAILVSTIYFTITPIGTFGSEIKARTEPTILDVLIAFFGGVAGIISVARKDISTTIPGVAIATALMPPLCVTGYGIANWETEIILSSFYLFFSNTFFICLSTYVIVRLLKFPFRKYPNKREKKRNMIYVTLFSLITIIPSLFILNKVIQNIDRENNIEKMLVANFGKDKEYLDDYKLITKDSLLILKVYGYANDSMLQVNCQQKLNELGLSNLNVKVLYTSEVDLNHFNILQDQVNSLDEIYIDSINNLQKLNAAARNELNKQINKNKASDADLLSAKNSILKSYEELEDVSLGNIMKSETDKESAFKPVAILKWKSDIPEPIIYEKENQIKAYLEGFFRTSSISIVSE